MTTDRHELLNDVSSTDSRADQPPARAGRPSVGHLVWHGACGTAYLVFVAGVLSQIVKISFLLALTLVFITITVEFALILVLVVGWASRSGRGPFQIRLSSIFLVVVIIAIYLSGLRSIVTAARAPDHIAGSVWFAAFIGGLLFLTISFPFFLFLGEAMLWLAVWLLRRRTLKRLLRRLAQRQRSLP